MKRIDWYLISNFFPPFIVTFFIAIFVLMMQTLWVYIDDIAGKGVGMIFLLEMVGYMCVSLIPMALPLAILISSVMVLGNLAERYELSSFKSAGVGLLRVLAPMMVVALFFTFFSLICSHYLIPISNLKFRSRLYDIQRQKPTLSLEEGSFNYDFQNYAIRMAKKRGDGQSIEDVLIYDQSETSRGKISLISAENGQMLTSADQSEFVMHLNDGTQYIEVNPNRSNSGGGESFPFVRVNFKGYTKVFDLKEFDLSRTDPTLFSNVRAMMNLSQLMDAADSMQTRVDRRVGELKSNTVQYYSWTLLMDRDTNEYKEPMTDSLDQDSMTSLEHAVDSLTMDTAQVIIQDTLSPKKVDPEKRAAALREDTFPVMPQPARISLRRGWEQNIDRPLQDYETIAQTFAFDKQSELFSQAKTYARTIESNAESTIRSIEDMYESKVKYIYEFHFKISTALMCIIFLFIGGPMGAIVRKGGFGYPILIAIIFFMLFVVLSIFCRKIAESFVVPAAVAGMIPWWVMLPVAMLLTHRARKDAMSFNFDPLVQFFKKWFVKSKS